MPYIDALGRSQLDAKLRELLAHVNSGTLTEGQLNYVLTRIMVAWVDSAGYSPSYADYNAAIGALECAKLELYARRIRPYEDGKRKKNGDVY